MDDEFHSFGNSLQPWHLEDDGEEDDEYQVGSDAEADGSETDEGDELEAPPQEKVTLHLDDLGDDVLQGLDEKMLSDSECVESDLDDEDEDLDAAQQETQQPAAVEHSSMRTTPLERRRQRKGRKAKQTQAKDATPRAQQRDAAAPSGAAQDAGAGGAGLGTPEHRPTHIGHAHARQQHAALPPGQANAVAAPAWAADNGGSATVATPLPPQQAQHMRDHALGPLGLLLSAVEEHTSGPAAAGEGAAAPFLQGQAQLPNAAPPAYQQQQQLQMPPLAYVYFPGAPGESAQQQLQGHLPQQQLQQPQLADLFRTPGNLVGPAQGHGQGQAAAAAQGFGGGGNGGWVEPPSGGICRRTRAHVSLRDVQMEELEQQLPEHIDMEEIEQAEDDEEYMKFLRALFDEKSPLPEDSSDEDPDFAADLDLDLENSNAEGGWLRLLNSPERDGSGDAGGGAVDSPARRTRARSRRRNNVRAEGSGPRGMSPEQLSVFHAQVHCHSQMLVQMYATMACDQDGVAQELAAKTKAMIEQLCTVRDQQTAGRQESGLGAFTPDMLCRPALPMLPPTLPAAVAAAGGTAAGGSGDTAVGIERAGTAKGRGAAQPSAALVPTGAALPLAAAVGAYATVPYGEASQDGFGPAASESEPEYAVGVVSAGMPAFKAAAAARSAALAGAIRSYRPSWWPGLGCAVWSALDVMPLRKFPEVQAVLQALPPMQVSSMQEMRDLLATGKDKRKTKRRKGADPYMAALKYIAPALQCLQGYIAVALTYNPSPAMPPSYWTNAEDDLLMYGISRYGTDWRYISRKLLPPRNATQIANRYKNVNARSRPVDQVLQLAAQPAVDAAQPPEAGVTAEAQGGQAGGGEATAAAAAVAGGGIAADGAAGGPKAKRTGKGTAPVRPRSQPSGGSGAGAGAAPTAQGGLLGQLPSQQQLLLQSQQAALGTQGHAATAAAALLPQQPQMAAVSGLGHAAAGAAAAAAAVAMAEAVPPSVAAVVNAAQLAGLPPAIAAVYVQQTLQQQQQQLLLAHATRPAQPQVPLPLAVQLMAQLQKPGGASGPDAAAARLLAAQLLDPSTAPAAIAALERASQAIALQQQQLTALGTTGPAGAGAGAAAPSLPSLAAQILLAGAKPAAAGPLVGQLQQPAQVPALQPLAGLQLGGFPAAAVAAAAAAATAATAGQVAQLPAAAIPQCRQGATGPAGYSLNAPEAATPAHHWPLDGMGNGRLNGNDRSSSPHLAALLGDLRQDPESDVLGGEEWQDLDGSRGGWSPPPSPPSPPQPEAQAQQARKAEGVPPSAGAMEGAQDAGAGAADAAAHAATRHAPATAVAGVAGAPTDPRLSHARQLQAHPGADPHPARPQQPEARQPEPEEPEACNHRTPFVATADHDYHHGSHLHLPTPHADMPTLSDNFTLGGLSDLLGLRSGAVTPATCFSPLAHGAGDGGPSGRSHGHTMSLFLSSALGLSALLRTDGGTPTRSVAAGPRRPVAVAGATTDVSPDGVARAAAGADRPDAAEDAAGAGAAAPATALAGRQSPSARTAAEGHEGLERGAQPPQAATAALRPHLFSPTSPTSGGGLRQRLRGDGGPPGTLRAAVLRGGVDVTPSSDPKAKRRSRIGAAALAEAARRDLADSGSHDAAPSPFEGTAQNHDHGGGSGSRDAGCRSRYRPRPPLFGEERTNSGCGAGGADAEPRSAGQAEEDDEVIAAAEGLMRARKRLRLDADGGEAREACGAAAMSRPASPEGRKPSLGSGSQGGAAPAGAVLPDGKAATGTAPAAGCAPAAVAVNAATELAGGHPAATLPDEAGGGGKRQRSAAGGAAGVGTKRSRSGAAARTGRQAEASNAATTDAAEDRSVPGAAGGDGTGAAPLQVCKPAGSKRNKAGSGKPAAAAPAASADANADPSDVALFALEKRPGQARVPQKETSWNDPSAEPAPSRPPKPPTWRDASGRQEEPKRGTAAARVGVSAQPASDVNAMEAQPTAPPSPQAMAGAGASPNGSPGTAPSPFHPPGSAAAAAAAAATSELLGGNLSLHALLGGGDTLGGALDIISLLPCISTRSLAAVSGGAVSPPGPHHATAFPTTATAARAAVPATGGGPSAVPQSAMASVARAGPFALGTGILGLGSAAFVSPTHSQLLQVTPYAPSTCTLNTLDLLPLFSNATTDMWQALQLGSACATGAGGGGVGASGAGRWPARVTAGTTAGDDGPGGFGAGAIDTPMDPWSRFMAACSPASQSKSATGRLDRHTSAFQPYNGSGGVARAPAAGTTAGTTAGAPDAEECLQGRASVSGAGGGTTAAAGAVMSGTGAGGGHAADGTGAGGSRPTNAASAAEGTDRPAPERTHGPGKHDRSGAEAAAADAAADISPTPPGGPFGFIPPPPLPPLPPLAAPRHGPAPPPPGPATETVRLFGRPVAKPLPLTSPTMPAAPRLLRHVPSAAVLTAAAVAASAGVSQRPQPLGLGQDGLSGSPPTPVAFAPAGAAEVATTAAGVGLRANGVCENSNSRSRSNPEAGTGAQPNDAAGPPPPPLFTPAPVPAGAPGAQRHAQLPFGQSDSPPDATPMCHAPQQTPAPGTAGDAIACAVAAPLSLTPLPLPVADATVAKAAVGRGAALRAAHAGPSVSRWASHDPAAGGSGQDATPAAGGHHSRREDGNARLGPAARRPVWRPRAIAAADVAAAAAAAADTPGNITCFSHVARRGQVRDPLATPATSVAQAPPRSLPLPAEVVRAQPPPEGAPEGGGDDETGDGADEPSPSCDGGWPTASDSAADGASPEREAAQAPDDTVHAADGAAAAAPAVLDASDAATDRKAAAPAGPPAAAAAPDPTAVWSKEQDQLILREIFRLGQGPATWQAIAEQLGGVWGVEAVEERGKQLMAKMMAVL